MTQTNASDDFMRVLQHYCSTLSPAEQAALMAALTQNQTVHYGTHHLSRGPTGHVRITKSSVYGSVIGVNTGVVVSFAQTAGIAAHPRPVGLPRTRHPIGYAAIHQALHATWAEVCQTNTPTWAVLTGARGMGRLPVALALGRTAVADGGQMIVLSFAPDATLPPLDPAYAAAIRTQWPQNTEVLGDPWFQLIAQQWPSFAAIPDTIKRWGVDGVGALRDVLYVENRPLVLILDGWEYAPEPWITLLRGLPSRGHASYPLLLIATLTMTTPWEAVTEESHPAAMAIRGQSRYPVVVHSFQGVSQTDIAMALGIEPGSELVAMLHQWSGGHPGLVEYLWDDWRDQGWIAPQQHEWRLTKPIELPQTYRTRMESLIDARLEESNNTPLDGATVHRALEHAAIEGVIWTAQVVAQASGCEPDDLMDLLDDCFGATPTEAALIEDRGFLEAIDETTVNRYQFVNSVLWCAYQPPVRNTEPRITVAHALETVYGGMYDDIAEQILFLYEAAGDHVRATPYYVRRSYRPTTLLPLLWQLDVVSPPSTEWDARTYYHLLCACSRLYYEQGQYRSALGLMEQFFAAAAWKQDAYLPTKEETIGGLNLYGVINRETGSYQQAEQQLQQALVLGEATFGAMDVSVGMVLNNLAVVFERQGQYAQAQTLLERALLICDHAFGRMHLDTATVVGSLARVLEQQGCYHEAEVLYAQGLAIQEKAIGGDHPWSAQSMNNLAIVVARQGRYAEAQALYERALSVHERVLGAEHPNTAQNLNNLAILFAEQERYEDAQALYERALGVREAVLGADHPDTARTRQNLAHVLEEQGLYSQAQLLYEQALAVQEAVLGADHQDTAMSVSGLVLVLVGQERYAEAQAFYERAIAINKRALGAVHPHTQKLRDRLEVLGALNGRMKDINT